MCPAVFGRQHSGEMIGNVHRPIALLQNLPIDQSQRAIGLTIDIPRMGIAVDKAQRASPNFGGKAFQSPLQSRGIADGGVQLFTARPVEQGLQGLLGNDGLY